MRHTVCLSNVLILGVPKTQGRLIAMVPHCPTCQRDVDDPRELTEGQTRSEWEWNDKQEPSMTRIYRQGDVLITATRKRPTSQAKPLTDHGRTILAYGEVTGHAHEVIATPAIGPDPVPAQQLFEEPDGSRLLVLKREAEVRHEEHRTIALPAGTYEVRRQMEYAPEALRNVAD